MIGDVVVLTMGDTVPADVRLFETMNLSCEEKNLTGESEPVTKETDSLETGDVDVGAGDRINMAFATTMVAGGRGRGVVVFTGMSTVVGQIAASAGHGGKSKVEKHSLTPKKKRKTDEEVRQVIQSKSRWKRPIYTVGYKISRSRLAQNKVTRAILGFLGFTEGTPLQRRLSMLAYGLLLFAIFLAAIVFGVNGGAPPVVVMYAISTGIAVIPEALVA